MENQQVILTDEQKKYVCSYILNAAEFFKLILAGYIIIFMSPVFYVFGGIMIYSFLKTLKYISDIKNDRVKIIVGEVIEKYEKNPRPHASGNRKWMLVLRTNNMNYTERRVKFHFYNTININDKVVFIETKSKKDYFKIV